MVVVSVFSHSFLAAQPTADSNTCLAAKAVGTPHLKPMEISLITVLCCMLSLYKWQFQFWGPDFLGFEYIYLCHSTDTFFLCFLYVRGNFSSGVP
jgi:hypothetical protein